MGQSFDSVYERVMSEARRSDPDNAYVFDCDEVIFRTGSKVKVLDPDSKKVIKKLTPTEYNDFKNDTTNRSWLYDYDYSDFDKFDNSVDPQPIQYTFKIIKNIQDKSRRKNLYILTARRSKIKTDLIKKLSEYGITIRPENIFCVGDSAVKNPKADIAEEKSRVLRMIRTKHSGNIEFYDDDRKNIEIARTIDVNGKRIRTRLMNPFFN